MLEKIFNRIRESGERYFSILANETTGVSRIEKLCVLLRYVYQENNVQEDFVGFFEGEDVQCLEE